MTVLVQLRNKASLAFSMVEMLISLALAGIAVAGVTSGFMQVSVQSQLSALSLAGHSQALRGMEQARAAKWDPLAYLPGNNDQLQSTNFPVTVEPLDLPMQGNNITYGTNRTIITTIATQPALRQIRVECTWTFMKRVHTNSVTTYRAPDQ
jgi:type II secretory pathway pseudopilin PulG